MSDDRRPLILLPVGFQRAPERPQPRFPYESVDVSLDGARVHCWRNQCTGAWNASVQLESDEDEAWPLTAKSAREAKIEALRIAVERAKALIADAEEEVAKAEAPEACPACGSLSFQQWTVGPTIVNGYDVTNRRECDCGRRWYRGPDGEYIDARWRGGKRG